MDQDNFCGNQPMNCILKIICTVVYLAVFLYHYKIINDNWTKTVPRKVENITSYTLRKKISYVAALILVNTAQLVVLLIFNIPYSNIIPISVSLFIFGMIWYMLLQEHKHLKCTSKHLRKFVQIPLMFSALELVFYEFEEERNTYLFFISWLELLILIMFYDLLVNKACNLQVKDLQKNVEKNQHKVKSNQVRQTKPTTIQSKITVTDSGLYESPQFNQLPLLEEAAEQIISNQIHAFSHISVLLQEYDTFEIQYNYQNKEKIRKVKFTDFELFVETIRNKYDNIYMISLEEYIKCPYRGMEAVQKIIKTLHKDEEMLKDFGYFLEFNNPKLWSEEYLKIQNNLMETFTKKNYRSTISLQSKLLIINLSEEWAEIECSEGRKIIQLDEKKKSLIENILLH